jgi:hypothetical protein
MTTGLDQASYRQNTNQSVVPPLLDTYQVLSTKLGAGTKLPNSPMVPAYVLECMHYPLSNINPFLPIGWHISRTIIWKYCKIF